jgi:hypothetical protein
MNTYANLKDFKHALVANVTITTHDSRLLEILESNSRVVDQYMGRHIYSYTDTRYFSGNGGNRMIMPWDLISITTLKEDTTADATYDNTWATTDYILAPYDAVPTGRAYLQNTRPYWEIEVDQRTTGSESAFGIGQRRFELVGKFGYSESTVDSGATVNETYTSTDTTLTVSDGTAFAIGETILIESEQLYITAISSADLTVQRGINGTTAASHASTTVISIIEYPNPIREAVLLESGLSLETHGYRRQIGNTDTGVINTFGRTFSDETKTKLNPYKIWRV